jgi:hypothetical protein
MQASIRLTATSHPRIRTAPTGREVEEEIHGFRRLHEVLQRGAGRAPAVRPGLLVTATATVKVKVRPMKQLNDAAQA